jgi:hypothetical protein
MRVSGRWSNVGETIDPKSSEYSAFELDEPHLCFAEVYLHIASDGRRLIRFYDEDGGFSWLILDSTEHLQ